MPKMRRILLIAGLVAGLAGCSIKKNDLADPPVPLGDFVLGHNIVIPDNLEMVPLSREASKEEWKEVMTKAMEDRFGRYNGTRMYDFGVALNAYALAPPGVPVVAAPKSVLVITVNIWDDSTQTRLNPKPKQLTIFEDFSADTVIGSGITRNKRKQMETLSYLAVQKIQDWLVRNPQWFTDNPQVGDNTENDPNPLAPFMAQAGVTPEEAAASPSAQVAPPAAAPATESIAVAPIAEPPTVPAN